MACEFDLKYDCVRSKLRRSKITGQKYPVFLVVPVCYRDNTVHSISVDELGRKIPSCSDTVEIPDHAPIKLMRMV